MKNVYIQTVIVGCAWCNQVISVSTIEVDENKKHEYTMLSHGICNECKGKLEVEHDLEESEVSDEEDLIKQIKEAKDKFFEHAHAFGEFQAVANVY